MTASGAKRIYCKLCGKFYYNKDNFRRHKEECKGEPAFLHLLLNYG